MSRLPPSARAHCMQSNARTACVRVLSSLAVRKFVHLRRAVDLSLAALSLLVSAAARTAL
ncbi:predicted protein [Streptomyces sviceus ATCC 29083]|uniref:Uncharacterized protein n=1 Tax=Streptomyces sviceus (strain ATCC 29083 / DSM 924 / JCM 4929 / NBRC 13980 / NCIMB 11184 / NRRL 5439 / UC 5370) TaxID=463191 RepID=B5HRV5_STRX2|nr:predicted protein [Streptomyces sviceus ATCC 29083]